MELSRLDYTQVNGANKGILTFLPHSEREPLVVGDSNGILSAFQLQENSVSTLWSHALRPITKLELYANSSSTEKVPALYVSTGSYIQGFSQTGRQTSNFDTNIAETISCFKVEENHLWTAGKYIYNHFVSEKDTDFMVLEDIIHDIEILKVVGDLKPNAVLACQDKTIRVLENADVYYSQSLHSAPVCFSKYAQKANDFQNNRYLLYGCSEGTVGLLHMEREAPRALWALEGSGEVTGLCVYDITGNGVNDIITARKSGVLEIKSLDGDSGELTDTFSIQLSEGITSVVAGKPRGKPEVVVSTFSGKVIGLGDSSVPKVHESQVLEGEIHSLKDKLEQVKQEKPLSKVPGPEVSHQLNLVAQEATYSLLIESQFPIEVMSVVSDVPIEVVETQDHPAKVNMIKKDTQVLATYCMPDNSYTRAEIKFTTTEGQSGNLQVYVLSALEPKRAQQVTVEISSLSLHEKVSEIPESSCPLNTLTVTGKFSKNEMHGWISRTLPSVPPHANESCVRMYYTSCVIGSVLIISYSNNHAEFKSDSVSTITILKESISQKASYRKVHLDMRFQEDPSSHQHILELVDQQISELNNLESQYYILDALKEIEIQGDLEKVDGSMKGILENSEKIRNDYTKSSKKLEFLQGYITDLYVDKARSQGIQNVADKIPTLQHILANYDFNSLLSFFYA